MNIHIEVKNAEIRAEWDNSSAQVSISNVYIGHLGCKLLGTLKDIPEGIINTWNQKYGFQGKWKNKKESKLKLSNALLHALMSSDKQGAVLWDTMRTGSDYWRPGKLLSDSVEMLPIEFQRKISYEREDMFCPPKELLHEFLNKEIMSFGEYAEEYSKYLNTNEIMNIASVVSVFNLSRNKLPIFYCVDPYIPDYADSKQFCSSIPYSKRLWLQGLRTDGCHRVIFVEELVKNLINYGIEVKVVEIDPTFETSYIRRIT